MLITPTVINNYHMLRYSWLELRNRENQWNLDGKFVLESVTVLKEEWGLYKYVHS